MSGSVQHQTLLNSDYGKSSKELIEFVGQLRALGAHIDVELPRIVVIGNQSAGKSSLVEAISGINVPRDAGTCTRCPMECRLSHSRDQWSCQIKIRWEYEADGRSPRGEVSETNFGPLLADKAQVEPLLRRAQAAILSPNTPAATFITMSDEQLKANRSAMPFSRNVVCVELSGPDLADLSFVDLPGIVQNADQDIVLLVENLVKSYIDGNSLILVTLPMSDDIENQKAARLAKLADPRGLRTIGVMTKPDTLTAGSTKARDLWLEVLEGRRHSLHHGYYCTRQPDDDERARGLCGPEARVTESAFFRNTAPWSGSTHQNRFGTTNLVRNVSRLLTQIIRESLPGILDGVATQLESCNTQLAKLPPAMVEDPVAFVYTLVTKFCADLKERVVGSPSSTDLVQANRDTYEDFKYAIRSTAPPFVPYKNATQAPADISQYVRFDGIDKDGKPTGTLMYLEDVKEHLCGSVTRELPGNVPYAAKLSLFQTFRATWGTATLSCFSDVEVEFKEAVMELIKEQFSRYSGLISAVKPVMVELMESCGETTKSQLRMVLELESVPFTQNGHYFQECRDKWLSKYKDARAGKGPAERVTPMTVPGLMLDSTFVAPSGGPELALPSRKRKKSKGQRAGAPAPSSPRERPLKLPRTNSAPVTASTSAPPASSSSQHTAFAPWASPSSGGSVFAAISQQRTALPAGLPLPPDTSLQQPQKHPLAFAGFRPPAVPPGPQDPEAEKREALMSVLSGLAKLGYEGVKETDLGKLNPPDMYEDELAVMAEVRAYFQVSYKRVIDYVPLTIDHHFLYAFADAIRGRLFERLGLGTPTAHQRCVAYVAEDPTVVATRDELLTKKKRLENVRQALFAFGMQVGV